MQMRPFGRDTGLSIAPLVLGGNVFGWTADEATSFAILDAFVGGGFNAVDTADVYSRWVPRHAGGESETVIGAWMASRKARDKVVLITKVGMDMGDAGKGLRKAHIVSAIEASLKRLKTDHVDVYLSHYPDAEAPIEETLDAHQTLIDAGKVRAAGGSNYDAKQMKAALEAAGEGRARYQLLQPIYNLHDRAAYEGALEDLCAAEGIGVFPYYGLASGFLTGKYRSEADFGKSPRGGRMKAYLTHRGLKILAALDAVSAQLNATPAQVALAWVMARPSIAAPIASATSVAQLTELMAAAALTLSAADIAELDAASEL
jgi:aryl-alcohol dehydrogenase-like predicted oxidoreductase